MADNENCAISLMGGDDPGIQGPSLAVGLVWFGLFMFNRSTAGTDKCCEI